MAQMVKYNIRNLRIAGSIPALGTGKYGSPIHLAEKMGTWHMDKVGIVVV